VFDKISNAQETHEIEEIIADGEFYGMQTFDQSLRNLYEQGTVTRRDAMASASNPHDLRLKLDELDLTRAQAALDGETTASA
jgi:twitching motility protein PilT